MTDSPSTRMTSADVTVADVVAACRTLPEPMWHRIVPDHPNPRRAATLIPVIDVDGSAAIVVTKRAGSLEHGGDWVFPGGRVDDADSSHADAARREASEELGVDIADLEVIGQLATRGPIVSGYVIENYVGLVAPGARFAPDASEVAAIDVIRIATLLDAANHHRADVDTSARRQERLAALPNFRPMLTALRHYRVGEGEHLWGLQAEVLHELLGHLTGGRHDF